MSFTMKEIQQISRDERVNINYSILEELAMMAKKVIVKVTTDKDDILYPASDENSEVLDTLITTKLKNKLL